MKGSRNTLVLGLGSIDRADDGVGPALVARLSPLALGGVDFAAGPRDAGWILGAWSDRDRVVVLDAVRSGGDAGDVLQIDPTDGTFVDAANASTHGLGLASAIELGRALGELPDRLALIGIEGACFDLGAEMSAAVRAALPEAAERVCDIVQTWESAPQGGLAHA